MCRIPGRTSNQIEQCWHLRMGCRGSIAMLARNSMKPARSRAISPKPSPFGPRATFILSLSASRAKVYSMKRAASRKRTSSWSGWLTPSLSIGPQARAAHRSGSIKVTQVADVIGNPGCNAP
jgi:hypothetical protein